MPVRNSSNNRILPANSRAADVAERAVQEITPVFQTRYANAFRVQGVEGTLYKRLQQGVRCTCQASDYNLGRRLGSDGKATSEQISELLGFDWEASGAGTRQEATITSPNLNNKHLGMTDNHYNEDGEFVVPIFSSESVKDDGAVNEISPEEALGQLDPFLVGFSDVACGVCFGSGFIGGYAPFHGYRQVLAVSKEDDRIKIDGQIDWKARPWRATVEQARIVLVIPKGLVAVDVCRFMYGSKPVNAILSIDGRMVTPRLLMSLRGKSVTLEATFVEPTYITHFEFQGPTSTASVYFELPRMRKSGDLAKLDPTQPFQIILSPDVPAVDVQDVIVEMREGRHLIVGPVDQRITRQRNLLGTTIDVRVAQPQEMFTALPLRGTLPTKNQTTVGVHDNASGRYRT